MSSTTEVALTASQLDDFGIIQISGTDTIKFLQGQITVNPDLLRPGQLALGANCNPQGRCISLFFIAKVEQNILLFLKRETLETAIANLRKYAVFFKVDITDQTKQNSLYGFSGISQPELKLITNVELMSWQEQNIAIIMVAKDNQALVEEQIRDISTISPEQNWLYQLTYKSISWLTQKGQSEFLPHNLNLPLLKAVDFNKGCFTGQEVIARMQYKGKLKSHIQLFKSKEQLEISAIEHIFVEDKKAAQLICGAHNEKGETALLALVKDRYLDDKIFRLGAENGPILELIKATDKE